MVRTIYSNYQVKMAVTSPFMWTYLAQDAGVMPRDPTFAFNVNVGANNSPTPPTPPTPPKGPLSALFDRIFGYKIDSREAAIPAAMMSF